MSKMKTIYFDDDLFNEITEGYEGKNFSERAKELIRKGLRLEQKGAELTIRDHLEAMVNQYNKTSKKPLYILPDKVS